MNIPELVEDVKKKLADTLLQALKENLFTVQDSRASAGYILDNTGSITSREQLLTFLHVLVAQWPVYDPVLKDVEAQNLQSQDDQKINEIKDKLKMFSHI